MTGFDLLYLALAPVALPFLGYRALTRGKYRESAPAMLGCHLDQEDRAPWKNGSVWVHAVSVGEVVAARAMLPLLREKFPGIPLLITTVTETGQANARSLVPEFADAARFYPADFSWVVKRFVDVYRPRVFVVMETELWPNAFRIASGAGARIFILNGRISDKSFPSYRRVRSLLRDPLSRVTAFCMQTEQDADRIATIRGSREHVFVTGNCKFDVDPPAINEERKAQLLRECGIAPGAPVIVAGSTHPGEEDIVLRAFDEISRERPDCVLLLVPRHPERFDAVWGLLRARGGGQVRRMSDGKAGGNVSPRIVLVDRMGILAELYGVASIAVVAGSLVRGIGGHNLLEAAVHGVPVVYGPYMEKQPDMTRILDAANGGTAVEPPALGGILAGLLHDNAEARRRGELGREAVLRNRGSARKNIDIISRFQ